MPGFVPLTDLAGANVHDGLTRCIHVSIIFRSQRILALVANLYRMINLWSGTNGWLTGKSAATNHSEVQQNSDRGHRWDREALHSP